MNIEEIPEFCISKPGVIENVTFKDTALAFNVAGKMFALLKLSGRLPELVISFTHSSFERIIRKFEISP